MPERGSKTSTVPVVWATFGIFSARSTWYPVAIGDPGYITMTQRQSNNQWSGGIATDPTLKNAECRNPLEKFLPRFFGTKTPSSTLIIFQRAKYQRGVLLISAGAIEGHSEGKKRHGKVTKGVLFLHDNAPAHRALVTQKKLACLSFQCLDHPPYSPDLAPSDYHLFPGLKTQLKVRHFSYDAEFIGAAETWLDGQYSLCFEWLAKVNCNGLRRELSFVRSTTCVE